MIFQTFRKENDDSASQIPEENDLVDNLTATEYNIVQGLNSKIVQSLFLY